MFSEQRFLAEEQGQRLLGSLPTFGKRAVSTLRVCLNSEAFFCFEAERADLEGSVFGPISNHAAEPIFEGFLWRLLRLACNRVHTPAVPLKGVQRLGWSSIKTHKGHRPCDTGRGKVSDVACVESRFAAAHTAAIFRTCLTQDVQSR